MNPPSPGVPQGLFPGPWPSGQRKQYFPACHQAPCVSYLRFFWSACGLSPGHEGTSEGFISFTWVLLLWPCPDPCPRGEVPPKGLRGLLGPGTSFPNGRLLLTEQPSLPTHALRPAVPMSSKPPWPQHTEATQCRPRATTLRLQPPTVTRLSWASVFFSASWTCQHLPREALWVVKKLCQGKCLEWSRAHSKRLPRTIEAFQLTEGNDTELGGMGEPQTCCRWTRPLWE